MREAYLRLVGIESLSEAQKIQLGLPLKGGGCGLRSHTLNELRRLFVSSAMLIAPAVHAAIGQRIGVAPDLNDIFFEDVSPFEAYLEDCIENLQTDLDIFGRISPEQTR